MEILAHLHVCDLVYTSSKAEGRAVLVVDGFTALTLGV